jgi:hypothetical protein
VGVSEYQYNIAVRIKFVASCLHFWWRKWRVPRRVPRRRVGEELEKSWRRVGEELEKPSDAVK